MINGNAEDNLLNFISIDKLSDLLARSFVEVCRLLREVMHASMHIGIDVEILLTHSVEDAKGLLSGSSIVEIYERFAINLA